MDKSSFNAPNVGGLSAELVVQDHTPAADYTALMSAPVTKLDADQYMAQDLDGVTESLSGSGNLNFLLLQSGQTNDSMALSNPFLITGEGPGFGGGINSGITFISSAPDSNNGFSALSGPNFSTDRALSHGSDFNEGTSLGGNNGFTSSTLASLSGSSFAGNNTFTTPLTSTNGTSGIDGNSGHSGVDGTSGTSGINGINGTPGDGTTIINVEHVLNNLIDVDVNHIHLGDIDLDDLTIIDLGDVTNITNNVTNIVDTIINNIFGNDGGPLAIQLDAVLGEITNLDLGIINGDTITQLVDQVVDLTPVTNIFTPVLGAGGLDSLVDVHSIFSILDGHQNHQPGDHDLGFGLDTNIGGLDITDGVIDIVLNPVEDVVGDVDILSDIGLDLFHPDHSAGDTDLVLGTGINLLGTDLLNPGLGLNLDPVENIVGDIDINLGAATDILGNTADGLVDTLAGGTGQDTLLAGIGDAASDLGHDLLGGILPDQNILTGDLLSGDNLNIDAIGDTLNNVGDTITDALNGQLPGGDILNDALNGHLPDLPGTDIVGDILNGNLGGDLPSGDLLGGDIVGDVLNGILPGGGDGAPDLGGIDLGPVTDILGNTVEPIVDNLAGGVDGGDLLPGVGDLLGGGAGDVLGGLPGLGNGDGASPPDLLADADLSLGGNDILHVDQGQVLDAIEPITGDIDLSTGGTGVDLLGGPDTSPGDTDLSTNIDLDVAGIDLPNIDFVDIQLDPVENIVGDIDININAAVDLLSPDSHDGGITDLGGNTGGGTDILSWPESVIPDGGDLVSGTGDALGGVLGSVLPDPVGQVSEGLGAVLGGSSHHHGLGGLFG